MSKASSNYDVERVGAEVFLKAGARCHFGFVHLKLLDNNLLDLLIYCCHRAISSYGLVVQNFGCESFKKKTRVKGPYQRAFRWTASV
jgi:hypothetical protein